MAKKSKELTTEDLLGALLDAQNRCNNLIGALFNEIRIARRDEQKAAAERWRDQNPELAHRCKDALEKLDGMYKALLTNMLDALDETGTDDFDSDFQLRDFLDKYGYSVGQMNTIVQTLRNLCS